MAIYYINPHTTTNGDGSFASPWSISSNTRTGLASGDEIRILGVALSSLLTATTYTVSITSNFQITVTAGGGLGADFAQGDIVYFPDSDSFARVTSRSGNVITFGTSTFMTVPWPDTSSGITGITLRKVDITAYPAGSTGTQAFIIGGNEVFSNLTISDCWTDATTRVTNGTVKTLFYTSSTGSSFAFTCINSTNSSINTTGNIFNLQNTHVLASSNAGTTSLTTNIGHCGATINVNQLYGPASSISIGSTSVVCENLELTISKFTGTNLLSQGYGSNIDINVGTLYTSNADVCFGNNASFPFFSDINITAQQVLGFGLQNSAVISCVNTKKATFHIENRIEQYGNTSVGSLCVGSGDVQYSFGSSFVYYRNRRASTVTTTSFGVTFQGSVTAWVSDIVMPPVVVPNGWTAPTTNYQLNYPSSTTASSIFTQSRLVKKPTVCTILAPGNVGSTGLPVSGLSQNLLITYKNGDNPIEILGLDSNRLAAFSNDRCPVVTLDTTTYQSTSPSLRAKLTTYENTAWSNVGKPIKNIKIPVTDGTSYTVTGYIRSDDTSYVNGDCEVSVLFDGVELDSQSMTTSCINAWEQFSLTFTATETGEAYLSWVMKFVNGNKSMWLSDLTIS